MSKTIGLMFDEYAKKVEDIAYRKGLLVINFTEFNDIIHSDDFAEYIRQSRPEPKGTDALDIRSTREYRKFCDEVIDALDRFREKQIEQGATFRFIADSFIDAIQHPKQGWSDADMKDFIRFVKWKWDDAEVFTAQEALTQYKQKGIV